MKFEDLDLHNETLQALHNNNQQQADSFQIAAINAVKSEKDLIIKAGENGEEQNAFAVAVLESLNNTEGEEGTQIIILSNNFDNLKTTGKQISKLKNDADCALIEPDNDEAQIDQIGKGHTIVLAAPERLHSVIKKNRYIFRHLELLILDGFDEMMAAREALGSIKKRILSTYTALVSSDAYNSEVKKALSDFVSNPLVKGFGPPPPPAVPGHLDQGYIKVPPRMKITTLMVHLKNSQQGNCIIFTDSKRGTDRLYRILKKQRMKAVSLHHKLSDERRAQRFANFTNGNVQYLLVSDISASELDISGVTQVVNYDVPESADEYRYRAALIGNGKNNQIVSLVSKQDQSDINKLRNELKQKPGEMPLPEKVKEKLQERKSKNRGRVKNGRSKGNGRQKRDELELPQPTFDQLSGGRSGQHNEEETGIVKFFKKLFS